MSKEIAIKVENLTKIYKLYDSPLDRLKESLHPMRKKYHHDYYALNDVSFEINKGETVGIIGQNGAGKSTLLKIITGVLTPSIGTALVNGKISALLELGAGFNPELTGIENVYFNGTLMGFSREVMATKLDDILSFADIGEFVHQPVKTYSSGMFVRLAFATAIHVEPQVLIIDEALSVGDIRFQARCFERIKKMRDSGVTIIHVTHAIQTFQQTCDYGILLENGKVYAEGEPKDVSVIYYKLQREREQNYQVQLKQKHMETSDVTNEMSVEIEEVDESTVGISRIEDETVSNEEKPPTFTYTQTESGEHRFGLKTAEITDFKILNDKDEETHFLESGKKFKVVVRIIFHGRVENPAVGVMVRNTQGMNLFGIHTYHDKRMNLGEKKRGDALLVTFESDMLLNPGKYIFNVGIADHESDFSYTNIDSRNNVAELDVVGKGFSYGLIHNNGNIIVEEQ